MNYEGPFSLASMYARRTEVRLADAPAHRNARTQDVTLTPRSHKRPRVYPEGRVAGLSACGTRSGDRIEEEIEKD